MAEYRTVDAEATLSDNIITATASLGNSVEILPVSIESVTWENDCCVVTLTDGTTYTSESMRGATGQAGTDGTDGVGIESISWNDYRMTIHLTDGTSYTSASLRGETGETGATGATGATGNGIASIVKTSTSGLVDTYTITYTDGTTTTFDVTNGADGQDSDVSMSDLLKAFPTDTASGATASFSDGANLPLKSLVVGIEPSQDLNGQDAPYPAGGGKNLCLLNSTTIAKPSWYTGGWIGVSLNNENGITQTRGYMQGRAGGFCISALPAGNYTLSLDYDTEQRVYCGVWYTTDGTDFLMLAEASTQMTLDSGRAYKTFTIPANQGVVFRPTYYSGSSAYDLNNIQLESGSTATSWSPYSNICPISGWTGANIDANGTAIAVDWTDEAGTVYGGTLDVLTGVLTVTHAIVDLGTLSWTYNASSLIGVPCFYATIPGVKGGAEYTACSCFAVKRLRTAIDGNCQIAPGNDSDATYCVARWDDYSDASSFTTAVTGQTLVYPLATPQTIQLTPQEVSSLLGSNTIYADTGDTSVEYRADPTLYIEKKITEAISALS